jgi:electron transfer flavoprotein alpha subunit
MAEILVVAEHRQQKLADISLQMLSKGRQLADQAGAELLAVVIGRNVDIYAQELARWADRVIIAKKEELEGSLAEPSQIMLSSIIKQRRPKLVLIGHSSFGMDLAPSLTIELGLPVITDCIDVTMVNDNITVTRSIYNGKLNAVYTFVPCETVIVTGRVGEFEVKECNLQGQIEEIDYPVQENIQYKKFEGYIEQEIGSVDIAQADIVVSIGRGIKEKENIEIAQELAELLGGVVACSRPIVDYGWLPPEHQVGLSGKTVQPKLYLALGISGAFQHVVGLKNSNMIVAINKDPRAPIFNIADYGVVDDIYEVVPALIQKIRQLKN